MIFRWTVGNVKQSGIYYGRSPFIQARTSASSSGVSLDFGLTSVVFESRNSVEFESDKSIEFESRNTVEFET